MIFSAAKCPSCGCEIPKDVARQALRTEVPPLCADCSANLAGYLGQRAMVRLLMRSALVGIGVPALFGGIAAWWVLR